MFCVLIVFSLQFFDYLLPVDRIQALIGGHIFELTVDMKIDGKPASFYNYYFL